VEKNISTRFNLVCRLICENGRLFEQVQNLTEQLTTVRELAASLDKTVNHLKEENFNLQSRLRSANLGSAPTAVDINSRKR